MLNLPHSVTITARTPGTPDPETGVPSQGTVTVLDSARCAFTILTAAERSQAWGDGSEPTTAQAVSAHLVLPPWSELLTAPLNRYSASVSGWPGTWRIVAALPGEQWLSYLVAGN